MESKLKYRMNFFLFSPDPIFCWRLIMPEPRLPSPTFIRLLGGLWSWKRCTRLSFLLQLRILFGRKRHVWWDRLDPNGPAWGI